MLPTLKKITLFMGTIMTLNFSLLSQDKDIITVRAGTRIIDYFPFQSRYRYPAFAQGKVFFHNNTFAAFKLNYNYLMEEMHYIAARDTMSITNKKDIEFMIIGQDTFFFDKVYLEKIWSSKSYMICLHEYIKLKEVVKKDSYGVASSGSSSRSYSAMRADGNYYKLSVNEDMVFQRVRDYYLAIPGSGFQPYTRKNLLRLFPQYEEDIKNFVKSGDIDFDTCEDLIKITEYLVSIIKT